MVRGLAALALVAALAGCGSKAPVTTTAPKPPKPFRIVFPEGFTRLQMAQRRAIEKVPGFDWAGRGAAEIMPPTFQSK